jgi:hypothetical protein
MRRFFFASGLIILGIILSACGNTTLTPTPYPLKERGTLVPGLTVTPASLTPTTQNEDDAIIAAAKQIVIAEMSIHYQDLTGWQTRLYPLCSEDGKKFWNTNVSAGLLSSVVTQQRVTQAVAVERAVVEQIVAKDAQRAAFVAVSGNVTYQDKTGKHTSPFAQRMMVLSQRDASQSVDNKTWKFVTLLSP